MTDTVYVKDIKYSFPVSDKVLVALREKDDPVETVIELIAVFIAVSRGGSDYPELLVTNAISSVSRITTIAFLIPNLAVSVRRMHDVGRSGWYLLMSLIPLVGWIFVLVACCTDSVPGSNEYGDNPKGQRDYSTIEYAAPAGPDYSEQAQETVFTDTNADEPVSDSAATTTGFCPYCDTPILVGQKFCTGCGHKVDV